MEVKKLNHSAEQIDAAVEKILSENVSGKNGVVSDIHYNVDPLIFTKGLIQLVSDLISSGNDTYDTLVDFSLEDLNITKKQVVDFFENYGNLVINMPSVAGPFIQEVGISSIKNISEIFLEENILENYVIKLFDDFVEKYNIELQGEHNNIKIFQIALSMLNADDISEKDREYVLNFITEYYSLFTLGYSKGLLDSIDSELYDIFIKNDKILKLVTFDSKLLSQGSTFYIKTKNIEELIDKGICKYETVSEFITELGFKFVENADYYFLVKLEETNLQMVLAEDHIHISALLTILNSGI